MMRALLVALAVAGPAAAQTPTACETLWARATAALADSFPLTGKVSPARIAGCLVTDVVVDMPGDYTPDWHADSLHLTGATDWLAGGATLPDRLDIRLTNLRMVLSLGDPQMDYIYAAQARATPIQVETRLAWDAGARVLALEGLEIDFPGDNHVGLSARLAGVDLSSTGAMQMSLASFALTEAELVVQTHGLFEWYALAGLGIALLPPEGDMEAAAEGLRADAVAAVATLPAEVVPDASKAALVALIGELPNPKGTLRLGLRAEPGIGPTRLVGPAMTGVPGTVAEAAALLEGVTLDIGWTHADAP
jgi:hypothetical protein